MRNTFLPTTGYGYDILNSLPEQRLIKVMGMFFDKKRERELPFTPVIQL